MADHPVAWLRGTGRTDWLFDGYAPPSEDAWQRLVWEQAYVDMGPSIMGNLGPYWHVPLRDEEGEIDTIHRLYPKLLLTKWLLIVRRACEEVAKEESASGTAARDMQREVNRAFLELGTAVPPGADVSEAGTKRLAEAQMVELRDAIVAAIEAAERAGYERGCRETCAAGMRAVMETKR